MQSIFSYLIVTKVVVVIAGAITVEKRVICHVIVLNHARVEVEGGLEVHVSSVEKKAIWQGIVSRKVTITESTTHFNLIILTLCKLLITIMISSKHI